jgi:hypothetical protein
VCSLLAPAAFRFRVTRQDQPLVSVSICRVAVLGGSPHQLSFESKLTVRALMWSANNGTPKSSCICLLLTYQGALVSRRRHLDYNTCSLRTWVRAADLHAELPKLYKLERITQICILATPTVQTVCPPRLPLLPRPN